MRESKFQAEVIRDLKRLLPGCVVLKNDASYIQGIPDLLVLFEDRWASLEVKGSRTAVRQPNQEHYVDKLDAMSFSAFIHPDNKDEVLDELQLTLRTRRSARLSKR